MNTKLISILLFATVIAATSGVAARASGDKNPPGVKCTRVVGGERLYQYSWPTPTSPTKPMKFYFLGVHEDDPGALTIRDVILGDFAKLRNVSYKYFTARGFNHPETQLNQLELAVGDPKTSGIILWMVDAKLVLPTVKKALAKHIPVVGFLDSLRDPRVVNSIYDDTTHISRTLMDAIIKKMGGRGEVATILGLAGSTTHSNFKIGAKQAVAAHPGVKLVAQKEYVGVDPAQTQQLAEQLLRQHPNLKGILTIIGQEAQGVARAVNSVGLKGKVVVGSWALTGPADFQAIAAGDYIGLGLPFVQWAHTAVFDVVTAAQGKPVPKWIAPPGQLYTKNNVLQADFTSDLLPKYLGKYGKLKACP